MDFLELTKNRYSVRSFSNKKVEKEKVLKILETIKFAPTAKNIQPIKVFYTDDDKTLKLLNTSSPCEYNAQLMFVVTYNSNETLYDKKNNPIALIDASIVSSHMVLEAEDLGVNSVYIAAFDPDIVRKNFKIPKENEIVLLLFMGYKTEDSKPANGHIMSKKNEELFEKLEIK